VLAGSLSYRRYRQEQVEVTVGPRATANRCPCELRCTPNRALRWQPPSPSAPPRLQSSSASSPCLESAERKQRLTAKGTRELRRLEATTQRERGKREREAGRGCAPPPVGAKTGAQASSVCPRPACSRATTPGLLA
jgi:hypothetical protein